MSRVYGKRARAAAADDALSAPSTTPAPAADSQMSDAGLSLGDLMDDYEQSKKQRVAAAVAAARRAVEDDPSELGPDGGRHPALRSSSSLRASGHTAACMQEIEYCLDGMEDASSDVRLSSAMTLNQLFARRSTRDAARNHGCLRRLAAVAQRVGTYDAGGGAATDRVSGSGGGSSSNSFKLHWQSAPTKAAGAAVVAAAPPLDRDFAMSIAALLFQINADGPTLDCMTRGCVHLFMRILAVESAALLGPPSSDDAALFAGLREVIARDCSNMALSSSSAAAVQQSGAAGGRLLSNRTRLATARLPSIEDKLAPYFRGDGSGGSSSSGSSSGNAAMEDGRAVLDERVTDGSASLTLLPRSGPRGDISLGDAALFLLGVSVHMGFQDSEAAQPAAPVAAASALSRSNSGSSEASLSSSSAALSSDNNSGSGTALSAPEGDTGKAASSAPNTAVAPSASAAAAATSDAHAHAIAMHVGATRDAVRTALRGHGMELLALKLAESAAEVRVFLLRDDGNASVGGVGNSPAAAREQPHFRRLLLLLRILEDASFLNDRNTAELLSCRMPQPGEGHATGDAFSPPATGLGSASLPQYLLALVGWCLRFALRSNMMPSPALRSDMMPSPALRSDMMPSPAMMQSAAGAPPASSMSYSGAAAAVDFAAIASHPVWEVLLGSLRVLVNLTNRHRAGAREVSTAATPLVLSSPRRCSTMFDAPAAAAAAAAAVGGSGPRLASRGQGIAGSSAPTSVSGAIATSRGIVFAATTPIGSGLDLVVSIVLAFSFGVNPVVPVPRAPHAAASSSSSSVASLSTATTASVKTHGKEAPVVKSGASASAGGVSASRSSLSLRPTASAAAGTTSALLPVVDAFLGNELPAVEAFPPPHAWYDALVLSLGLLINCVEYDPEGGRDRLLGGTPPALGSTAVPATSTSNKVPRGAASTSALPSCSSGSGGIEGLTTRDTGDAFSSTAVMIPTAPVKRALCALRSDLQVDTAAPTASISATSAAAAVAAESVESAATSARARRAPRPPSSHASPPQHQHGLLPRVVPTRDQQQATWWTALMSSLGSLCERHGRPYARAADDDDDDDGSDDARVNDSRLRSFSSVTSPRAPTSSLSSPARGRAAAAAGNDAASKLAERVIGRRLAHTAVAAAAVITRHASDLSDGGGDFGAPSPGSAPIALLAVCGVFVQRYRRLQLHLVDSDETAAAAASTSTTPTAMSTAAAPTSALRTVNTAHEGGAVASAAVSHAAHMDEQHPRGSTSSALLDSETDGSNSAAATHSGAAPRAALAAAGARESAAEDVVVSAYIALLLGCAMRGSRLNQEAILCCIEAIMGDASTSSCGGASRSAGATTSALQASANHAHREHAAISSLRVSLRLFVALQGSAGVLDDEAIAHITAADDVFREVQRTVVDGLPPLADDESAFPTRVITSSSSSSAMPSSGRPRLEVTSTTAAADSAAARASSAAASSSSSSAAAAASAAPPSDSTLSFLPDWMMTSPTNSTGTGADVSSGSGGAGSCSGGVQSVASASGASRGEGETVSSTSGGGDSSSSGGGSSSSSGSDSLTVVAAAAVAAAAAIVNAGAGAAAAAARPLAAVTALRSHSSPVAAGAAAEAEAPRLHGAQPPHPSSPSQRDCTGALRLQQQQQLQQQHMSREASSSLAASNTSSPSRNSSNIPRVSSGGLNKPNSTSSFSNLSTAARSSPTKDTPSFSNLSSAARSSPIKNTPSFSTLSTAARASPARSAAGPSVGSTHALAHPSCVLPRTATVSIRPVASASAPIRDSLDFLDDRGDSDDAAEGAALLHGGDNQNGSATRLGASVLRDGDPGSGGGISSATGNAIRREGNFPSRTTGAAAAASVSSSAAFLAPVKRTYGAARRPAGGGANGKYQ